MILYILLVNIVNVCFISTDKASPYYQPCVPSKTKQQTGKSIYTNPLSIRFISRLYHSYWELNECLNIKI